MLGPSAHQSLKNEVTHRDHSRVYFVLLVHAANATSIIAVRVNEQVIVGADSKRRG